MTSRFDVVVGGGSAGGLSFAAEAAKRGLSVLVLEEDDEIGETETCDGMVGLRQLRRFFAPSRDCIQSQVRSGTVHSPDGQSLTFDASRMEVVVLDRSRYDKQLAEQAEAWGAKIKLGCRVLGTETREDSVRVAADEAYDCPYFVDAMGPASLVKKTPGQPHTRREVRDRGRLDRGRGGAGVHRPGQVSGFLRLGDPHGAREGQGRSGRPSDQLLRRPRLVPGGQTAQGPQEGGGTHLRRRDCRTVRQREDDGSESRPAR